MTDYAKLIRDENPYDALIQGQQSQALQGAMAGAAATQPDTEAKLQGLAQRLGVPVDSVRSDLPQAERSAKIGAIDYTKLVKDTPVTSGFLTENAAVASDDIDALTSLEKTWKAFTSGIQKGSLQDDLGPLHYKALTGQITPAEQQRRKELNEAMKANAANTQVDGPLDWFLNLTGYTGRQLVSSVREGAKGGLVGASGGATAALIIGQLGPQVGLPEELVTVPGAALFGARAGYITASTVYNYQMESGFAFDEYENLKDENGVPLSRDVAQGAAAAVGLLNAGLETMGDVAMAKMIPGLDKLLAFGPRNAVKVLLKQPTFRNAVAQAGKKWIQSSSIEGVTEGLQELTVILGRDVATALAGGEFRTPTMAQDAERVAQAAVEGAVGAAGVTSPGAAAQTYSNVRDVQRAQANQRFMEALGEGASASKLRERLPEKFREMVAKVKENGPVENVYIPAEQFTQYFQSVGVNPAQVAEQVGARNYSEAAAAGTDLVIPLEDYTTYLAATEHHSNLIPDIRLHQGDMTPREVEQFEQERKEREAELVEMMRASTDENATPAMEQIKQQIMGELVGRFERSTADAYATAYAKAMTTLAQRAGVDPMELSAQYGVRVQTPLPEVLTQRGNVDTALDPLLDRLRAGDIPTEAQAMGPSLAEFVRDLGGLQPSEEVLRLDESMQRKPGQKKLAQVTGLDPDAALEAAIEAGYFPGEEQGTVSVADFLNALDDDVRGTRRAFSNANENPELMALRESLTQLDEYLTTLGADLNSMDNAAVKQLVNEASQRMTGGQEFDQTGEGDKRGFIQIAPDRKITIALLEKADLSTFLHETGHFYLEVMSDLAERPGANEQIKQDYQTLLDWFGVKSRAEIGVEQHEMFARANEAYLMEGKAPSAELRGVFQRFRAWLNVIYRSLTSLNVRMNDDVRGVFDRIYATDAEIEAASKQLDVQPLFTTAADAGLSDAEFDAYRKEVERTTASAKEKLQTELMAQYQREREKWWKEQREQMRQTVEQETNALPVYQAFDALTAGKLPDGTPLKLSKDDLVRRYGAEYLKRLPRSTKRVYSVEGGTDVDTAADVLGYDSGDALVQELVNMRNKRELIEAETDRRMYEQHGEMRLDGTITEEAMQALHNEERAKVLATELKALNRLRRLAEPAARARDRADRQAAQTALDIPPVQAFRDAARGLIGQMQTRDLNPYQYLLAERKASKKAFEAAAKKDYMTAAIEKQRELMNHYLYLEATKAKARVDKIYDYQAKFDKPKVRQKFGKAGEDYLDQIDQIRERFEFAKVTLRQLGRREALATFVAEQERQGFVVNVPDILLEEARRVNYKQLTVDELNGIYDTMRNIEKLVELKTKLLRKKEQIEFEQVENELVNAVLDNWKGQTGESGQPNTVGLSVKEKGAKLWRSFDASLLKIEQLVQWLDGGKIDGPWARYFFDLADDAQTREYELHAKVTKQIQDIDAGMPKEWRSSLIDKTKVMLPGINGYLDKYTLISVALNTGNEGNYQRLRDGYGWTDAQIATALDELNANDWKFVQGVWDTVESLWPEIVEVEQRMAGVAPPKIEARSFTNQFGTFRGGYFPAVYDPNKSEIGKRQADVSQSVADFAARTYGRASTDKGHTKARAAEVKQPLMLDYEKVLTGHLHKVIKDVSHREAIYSLNKILTSDAIRGTLIDTIGEARYQEMNRWVQGLVLDRADSLTQGNAMLRMAMKFRTNMAIVTMGWKITTMMAQFAGFGPSMDLVKPKYMAQALIEFNKYRPFSAKRDAVADFVFEKSGEMRFRTQTIERDVRDALRRMRDDTSPMAAIRKTAFYLTAMADRQVTVPTWLGAYRQGLAEGLSEEDAIRAGDRAVRLSQGAGGAKDLAAVQRNNELLRLITMFYSPFSVLYARLRDVGMTTGRMRDLPRAAARILALVVLPAVLGDLLAGKGPDDDEDEVWWAIRKSLLYPFASVPIVRDFSSFLEAGMIRIAGDGEMQFAPSFRLSPVVSAADKLARTTYRVGEAAAGERPWDDVAWDAFEMSGYVLGLPTMQPRISGEFVYDVLTDEAEIESAQQVIRDLFYRRDEK